MRLCTLKRSVEFRRIRGGFKWSGPGFLIEGKRRQDVTLTAARPVAAKCADGSRFGFTVTRKLGCAVTRNRIRRRLREAIRGLDGDAVTAGFDYVVVARGAAADRPFADLERDFRRALGHIQRQSQAAATGASPRSSASDR